MKLRGALRGLGGRTGRRVLVAAAVLAVVAVAWQLRAVGADDGTAWAEAVVGDLVIRVDVEGALASEDSSVLTPPQGVRRIYDFKISMMAPEGEEVDAGTPVLAFDPSELQRLLRDRQTQASQAARNLEKLERDLEQKTLANELRLAEAEAKVRRAKLKVFVPEDLASARELEKARLDLQLSEMEVVSMREQNDAAERSAAAQRAAFEAQRTRAERQVREIESAIEMMTVTAPRSGTVIYVTDYRGEKKKVGDAAWRSERIMELPDLRAMLARGEVDEADAGRVAKGQPFRIRLDAHPEVEYTGAVSMVSRQVQRKSLSRNPLKAIRVELTFDETDIRRMRPGMRFRGTIETERAADVLLIPTHTVFPSADGPVVYRRTLLGYERVAVELGRRNESLVEVLDGLQPGDLVAERSLEGL